MDSELFWVKITPALCDGQSKYLEATREWLTETTDVHLEQITEEAADRKRF